MRHRLEQDHELVGQLQREHRFLAGRQFDGFQRHLVDDPRNRRVVQVHPRAPEHLAGIFPDRQRMGIVRCDAPDARAHREGDLDPIVDRRFVALGAERAIVVVVAEGFQRVVRAKHAAASWAQHVPGQIEQPEPRRMQEGRNDLLLVESIPRGKIQHVDPVEVAIVALGDQLRNGVDDRGIGSLPQH